MYPRCPRSLPSRLVLVSALASLGVLTISPPVLAKSSYLTSWRSSYPDSTSEESFEVPCGLCHTTQYSQLNAYGWDFSQKLKSLSVTESIKAIESLNSDNDPNGTTNLEEIKANTQPGWTEGPNNVISTTYDTSAGTVSTNAAPLALIAGMLDAAAANQAPVADIGGPYSGTEKIALAFDASNSSDSDGTLVGYAWDFGDGSTGTGVKVSHTYAATGTYSVTLIVTDDAGDSATETAQVTIGAGNQPPTADAKGPYMTVAGKAVEFDGSGSSDSDGSIVSYDWSFGDGATGSGVKPTHTYTSKGTYNVTLTVTDDGNAVDSVATSVSVDPANQAPTADPAGPYIATAGEKLVFDATGSMDSDGSISTYAWDFGDGTTGSGANPSHTYSSAGTYNVTLKVTDNGGLSGMGMTTAKIGEVDKQAPVAVANGPYSGTVNMALPFSSDGSEDADGSIVAYVWDFGDGGTASGANVSHTYTTQGSYNVTLQVQDNDGLMDSASTTAVIGQGNLAPTSNASGPYSAKVNQAVQFDGSGSQDADGSIVAYDWNFGDGATGSGVNPSHSYAQPGTYNVSLTVYDDSGAMDADVTTVTVTKESSGGGNSSGGGSVHVGKASINKAGDWGSAFQGEAVIVNDTNTRIGSWTITFDADFNIGQVWNAEIVSHTGQTYVIKAAAWNKAIAPGSEVRFGFIGNPGGKQMPAEITVADATRPDAGQGGGSDALSTQVTMKNVNDWGAAFQGMATVANTGSSEINGWEIAFDASFEIGQIWNAKIVSHEGTHYVIQSAGWNDLIAPGAEASFGFIASPGGSAMPSTFSVNGKGASSGGSTGGDTGGNTGGDTGGNTGGDTGGNTGGDTGGNTGGDTGGNTGGDTGGSTGDAGTCSDGELFCEDFESFTDSSATSNAWSIESRAGNASIDAVHARGNKALHLTTTDNGMVFLVPNSFSPAGNSFFGRMWLWVDEFPTKPDYAHFTMVEASGSGSGTLVRPIGGQYIPGHANDIPLWGVGSDGGPTGDWTSWQDTTPTANGRWTCMEWQMDATDNAVNVWIDGVAKPELSVSTTQHGGNGDFVFPDFNKIRLGWQLYQGGSTPPNFNVWLDDLALSGSRIGCGGDTGGNTGGDTGGNTGGDTGGNTGGDTGGNTGGDTGGSTGGDTGGNTGGDTGGNTGGDTGGNTGGDTGGSTGGDTGGDTGTGDINACTDTTYGPRMLKLLTRSEYQNSVEDLVGIDFNVSDSLPIDSTIEGYFNNAFIPATESHIDAYMVVAEKVAAWSAQRNFQGVVDCGFDSSGNTSVSYQECESRFLNDFGTRAFRRPLTSAEMTTYRAVFNDSLTGGDIKSGLELGVTAMLTSPQFLYRSEIGKPVQELLDGSSGTASDGNEVTVNGASFQTKTVGGASGNGWIVWSEGYIGNSFTLADDALLQISMKGDSAQGVWPEMELAIDGTVVATATVDSNSYRVYEFNVGGYAGTHQVQIHFTNDYFVNGEDRNLYVEYATVSGTQPAANVADSIDLTTLDSDAYVLSDYEVASFLSYTFTGSTPDQALLTAAKNGELQSTSGLRAQVERLLSSDKAKKHMGNFAAQWLGTDGVLKAQKDSSLFPDFTDEVREAMASEVRAFFTHVVYGQDTGFSDLYNADYVFVNKALADFYGLQSVSTTSTDPAQMVKVDGAGAHRGGLVTMGAFLANYADLVKSSPVRRAVNLRLRMLCQDSPQPDATIASFRAELADQLIRELQGQVITNRDFVAGITKESPCDACHDEIINPLGFGLEDYDASGRYRVQDHNGLSINSSGTLYGVNSLYDGNILDFSGGKDLSNKLAEEDVAQSCFTSNVFRFAMDIGDKRIDVKNENARELTAEEKQDYACSVDTLSETLKSSNSIRDLLSRLGTLDLIRFRKQRDL